MRHTSSKSKRPTDVGSMPKHGVPLNRQRPGRLSCLSSRRKTAAYAPPLPDRPFPNPLAILEQGPDGWRLLLNPDTGAAVALNPTGTLIWRLVDGRKTVTDIVEGVRRRYPDAPGSMADDVAGLLGTLSNEGLIGREVKGGARCNRL